MAKQEQTEFEKKVLEQFMSGKNLFGEGGAFAPLLKNVIEKALEAEMEVYSPLERGVCAIAFGQCILKKDVDAL